MLRRLNFSRLIPAIGPAVCAVAGLILLAPPAVSQTMKAQGRGPIRVFCHPTFTPIPVGPQPNFPKCTMCACTASPCYVASGAFVTEVRDVKLPTTGFPISASRSYNSARAVDGPLGVGWTAAFTERLFEATYLFSAPSTYSVEADVVLSDGTRLRFSRNADGRTYSLPTGRFDLLIRNADDTYDLSLQHTRSIHHFGPTGALLSITDDYGNTLTFNYDGSGRLTRITDAAGSGRYMNVFYGAAGRISNVLDSANRQVQYTYDSAGLLRTVVDPAGRSTNYAYTDTGAGTLLSEISDGFGRAITTVTYNSMAQVGTLYSNGETWTYTYATGAPNITTKTPPGPPNNRWLFTFNPDGLITDRTRVYGPTNNSGPTVHTDYNPDGSVRQVTDEIGIKTLYTYDSQGRVTSVTRDSQGPLAVRFDYTYDPTFPDKVTAVTPRDPATGQLNRDWQEWQYDYYQAGAPAPGTLFHVYRIRSDGTRDTLSTYVYDSHGRVIRTTSAVGGVTDYGYDTAGNLGTLTGPPNNDAGTRPVTTYAYDTAGRITSIRDPLGHVTSYSYDGVDRVTVITLPKPSSASTLNFTATYGYDVWDSAAGLTYTDTTDPNGLITRQGYDQWGRLVRSVDALDRVTSYAYGNGVLASTTDANGNVTAYSYDDLSQRLYRVTYPDGATASYQFYSDLTVQFAVIRGATAEYRYDSLKRVNWEGHDSAVVTYSYLGQKLVGIDEGSGSAHAFSYDTRYRVASETQSNRGTITRTYYGDDSPAGYAIQGGPTASYAYYPDGSLNTISWSPVASQFKYRYTLAGGYQQITFPNGFARNLSYDDQGRLTQIGNVDPVAGNIATYAYGYDLNQMTGAYTMLGQRVSMTATVPSQGLTGHLTKYEYDSLYQLTKATYPGVGPFNGEVDSWTYDAIGNRLTNTVNGVTQTYAYQKIGANPNNWQKLLSDGVNTYTWGTVFPSAYPAPSSITGPGGAFNFGYNHRGQTTSISGSVAASYGYDYQGRRGWKMVAGATSSYLYDGLNLVRETGATPAEYLFGPGIDEPLAMSRGGQVYYYATDALGSVAAVTNSGGAVQDTYSYDAWGVTRRQIGSLGNPFGYTAREFGEAGQFFYRARSYRPSVGRFLSEDDPKQQNGPNAYAYVSNAPARFTDPTGLAILRCWRPLRFPLNILPYFTGPLTIPVPENNWCPLHEYVYNTAIPDSKGFDPKENKRETGRDNCRVIPEPVGTCVWNTFEQAAGPRADYNFITNNCHNAVNRAVERCTPCAAAPPIPPLPPWFNDKR